MASATSTPWLLRDTTPPSRGGSAATTPARTASYTATPSRGSFTSPPSRSAGSFTGPPSRTAGSFSSPPPRTPGSFSGVPPRSPAPATGALASPPTSPVPALGSTHVRSPSSGAGATTLRTAGPPAVPPRLTLICFPPSGTGAGVYFGWQCRLPPGVEMLAVELPARASRMKHKPIDSMRQLMDEMLPEMLPILRERPFVFFGHSMGAWLAYQATQELARRCWPLPLKVFISANRSPLLADPAYDLSKKLMHLLSEEKFWEEIKVRYGENQNMEHPDVRKLMLPMMMADYKLMETWEPWGHDAAQQPNGSSTGAAPAPPPPSPPPQPGCCSCFGMGQPVVVPPGMVLPCPLAAFGAEYDNRLTKKQLSAWVHVAPPAQYEELWFRGGHTYATYDGPGRQAMLAWLGDDLVRIMDELDATAAENSHAAAAATAAGGAAAAAPATAGATPYGTAASNGAAAASPAAPALDSWLAQAQAAEEQAQAGQPQAPARKSSAAEIAVEEEHVPATRPASAAAAPKQAVAERQASDSKEQPQEGEAPRSGFCAAFTCCFG